MTATAQTTTADATTAPTAVPVRPQPTVHGTQPVDGASETQPAPPARDALELVPWLSRYRRRGRPTALYHRTKRVVDLAAVLGTAPLWGPAYAAAALAVRADGTGGPVHFAQQRTATGGRRVALRKLRTMVPDAEERKAELAHLNEREWPDFKITDDPRITRIGRLLRATSLDELPQLVSVLRGDLSLVGPRPWSRSAEHHEPWHLDRYAVPAGLTGLWQIAARDAASFTERIRLDLAYKQRRCLRLDLEILVRTIPAVLGRQGT
jgi:lipopolysaccharide/colanic/teichoic acid biosynthesis glycosyltransferase